MTGVPLALKGVLLAWRRITGTLGPLALILRNSSINDPSTNTQKRSRKFGAQGPLSKGHWKSSALVGWSITIHSARRQEYSWKWLSGIDPKKVF